MKRHRAESPSDLDCLPGDDDIRSDTSHNQTHLSIPQGSHHFALTEDAVEELVSGFMKTHNKCKAAGYRSNEINGIVAALEPERKPSEQYPPALPVSLYGRIGNGKSLTISCILDTPNISADSDGVHRGTLLVHEFSTSGPWQTTKFEVNSRYHPLAKISDKVKGLCQDIFAHLMCNESPNTRDESDHDENADKQLAYDEALSYFRTLLCGTKFFNTFEQLENSFINQYHRQKAKFAPSGAQEVSSTETAKKMMDNITELMRGRKLVNGIEERTADTSEGLSDALAAVSATGNAEGPQVWPLISKVEVHSDLPFLKGVVIADTPGIMDSNKAVVEGTMAYISQGGHVLIVMPIERCGEDSDLDDILKLMCRLNKQDQTIVVLTKIDLINDITPDTRTTLTPKHAAQMLAVEEQIEALETEQEELRSRTKHLLPHLGQQPAALTEYLAKIERTNQMPILISQAENRIKQILVEDRNLKAKASLAGKFKKLMSSNDAPDLPVHCVSGSEYKKYSLPQNGKNSPWLTKEGTGIPELQRMLLRLPAAKKLVALQLVCQYKLPTHFRNIIAALEKHELKAHGVDIAQFRSRIIAVWKTNCKFILNYLEAEMKTAFHEEVALCFRQLSVNGSWGTQAKKLIDRWGKLHSATFRAVCKKSGTFRPKNAASVIDWNGDIEDAFIPKVVPSFAALDHRTNSVKRTTKAALVQMKEELSQLMKENKYRNLQTKDGFLLLVNKAIDHMIRRCSTLLHNLSRDFRSISLNTTTGEVAIDSYVSRAMQESYDTAGAVAADVASAKYAKKTQGGRAHRVRVDIIRDGLFGTAADPANKKAAVDSVAEAVVKLARSDFRTKVEQARSNLEEYLNEALETITTSFDSRWTVTAMPVSKDAKHMKILLGAAREAMQQLDGPIKGHLDACQAYLESAGQEEDTEAA